MRRLLLGLVLAGTLTATTAPVVFAHECVISNRSAQGDAAAQHSSRWVQLTLTDIYGFIHMFVGGPALSPGQIEWAVNEAVSQGLPADGWVVRSDKTIGEGSANPNLANGKGLDWLSHLVGEQVIGIYFAALSH